MTTDFNDLHPMEEGPRYVVLDHWDKSDGGNHRLGVYCCGVKVKKKGLDERRCFMADWAALGDAVYVLHAFGKKSGKTPKSDIDTANARYRQLKEAKR